MDYMPDNYDLYEMYEKEQERLSKVLGFHDVPNDYGTHKECYPNYKEEEECQHFMN